MWFETLTGFPEESPQQVRENITVDGQTLTSHVNGKVFVCGQLETPTLAGLREQVQASGYRPGEISVVKSLPMFSTYTQTYRMPGRFSR